MRLQVSFLGWRDHVVIWLLLIAILAVVGVAVRTFLDYRSAAIDLLMVRDQKVTYLSAARLRDELSRFVDSLTTLANDPGIAGGVPSVQRETLQKAQPVQEGVFDGGIALLDNFGHVIAAEPDSNGIVGADWSNQEFFRQMLTSATVYFSDLSEDPRDSSGVVVVTVPVEDDAGQFVGVLAGMLRLGESTISPLYATIVRLRVGQYGGAIYVVDSSGAILFDSVTDRVGEKYADAGLSETLLSRQPGALRTVNNEERPVIAAYAPIPGTPWTLIVEDDWRVASSATQRYLQLLTILLTLGVALLVAGAFLLIRRLPRDEGNYERDDAPERVGQQIKQMLLPASMPVLPGWDLNSYFPRQPELNGDFYDLLLLRDGRLMVAMGDVHDSGLDVAVTLATTRTTLRAAARSMLPPAKVLERSNEFLCPELPPEVKVPCFFALLDPSSGNLQFSNAGYYLPIQRKGAAVETLKGNGIPLGEQLGSTYNAGQTWIEAHEWVLFHNGCVTEIRNGKGETFGLERLHPLLTSKYEGGEKLIQAILDAIQEFIGTPVREIEDIALLVVERLDSANAK